METTAYRVQLDVFTGPLDLLLYLVRRNEISIVEMPIAQITDQFRSFLDVLEWIDLDLAGDFVVMASTLTEIKSRLVLPRPEEQSEDEAETDSSADELRSGLIQQLLEYKRFKDAALELEQRAARWQERYPRLSDDRPTKDKDPAADYIKEVELWDLVSALSRVVRIDQVEEVGHIRYDETPVAVYVEQIAEQVRAAGQISFGSLFDKQTVRSKIVGLFLAVLELVRHHHFHAVQEDDYGEIFIRPPRENDAADMPDPPPSAEPAPPSVRLHQPDEPDDVDDGPA